MKIIFLGDIVGSSGREAVFNNIKNIKEKYEPEIIIANAGISSKSFPGQGTFELDKEVIKTNLLGSIATIDELSFGA